MNTFLVVACVIGWVLFGLAAFSRDPQVAYLQRDNELGKRYLKQYMEENKRLLAKLRKRKGLRKPGRSATVSGDPAEKIKQGETTAQEQPNS